MSGSTFSTPGPPPMPAAPPIGALGGPSSGSGLVRVVSPGALQAREREDLEERERRRREARMEPAMEDLAAHVRKKFEMMCRHRDSDDGWSSRMLKSLRMFNGEYEPDKLAQIRAFGGSEVYARLVAVKCRAAAAMLRDIYLTAGPRPWDIAPSPVPTIPDDTRGAVDALLAAETGNAAQVSQQGAVDPTTGMPLAPPSEEEIAARKAMLETALDNAARKRAREEAQEAQRYLDDVLVEGGFYEALSDFIADLTVFPFACIHGPVVHMTPQIKWERDGTGQAKLIKKNVAKMFWKRVSPFDVWWTPGASTVMGADFITRDRKSRSEINALLGVPGYNEARVRDVLDEYPSGYVELSDFTDSTRAEEESRENPQMNESGMYDCLRFDGSIQGRLLREFGMKPKDVPDETVDYSVQLWMIGRYVLKVQLAPSPRERPPFYITSYNKVPGTMIGDSVPDVLSDIQDVCNATLRALVNNIAMSSGPQIAINENVLGNGEDTDQIWPWRVWKWTQRPGSTVSEPVKFFQPTSNAQAMMGVYEKFVQIADETSAIPRYTTGSERMGGAGRTASGLAMLMGNASKMLQTVASNIDTDVFGPLLQYLYDIVMLTDRTGRLRGDEKIVVKGITVAIQRETERQRQIEMLQATANPMDSQIIGMRGRGALLRAVSEGLGLDGESVVPADAELADREKMIQAAAMAQANAANQPGGAQPGAPGQPGDPAAQAQGSQRGGAETGPRAIQGPRVNLQSQAPAQQAA